MKKNKKLWGVSVISGKHIANDPNIGKIWMGSGGCGFTISKKETVFASKIIAQEKAKEFSSYMSWNYEAKAFPIGTKINEEE